MPSQLVIHLTHTPTFLAASQCVNTTSPGAAFEAYALSSCMGSASLVGLQCALMTVRLHEAYNDATPCRKEGFGTA